MNRIFPYLVSILLLCAVGSLSNAPAQQPTAGQTFVLAKIDFVGLKQLKLDEAIAASGLSVGQTVDEAALDKAAGTLMDSGLFTKLSYRLQGKSDAATVTFTVDEAKVRLPVVFDNFIWFTDDELFAAVRKEVPIYDGTAPESGDMVEGIKRALMNLLRSKKIGGTVEFAPATGLDLRISSLRYVFKGDELNVCSVAFPGAAEIQETVLQRAVRTLLGKEYSRAYTSEVAREVLTPLYRKRGMLKVSYGIPQARPGVDDCDKAVAVTVPVEEGFTYHWSNVDWSGNSAVESPDLLRTLDIKSGDVADGLKFDAGLEAIRKYYGQKGYIMSRLKPEPDFDDEKKLAGFRITVTEGPQFLMGNLNLSGLPTEELAKIKAKWTLQPGDVYDSTYLAKFVRSIIVPDDAVMNDPMQKPVLRQIKASTERPNLEKRTVEVTITFGQP